MSQPPLRSSAWSFVLLLAVAAGCGGGGGPGADAGTSAAGIDVARCTLEADRASAVADNTEGIQLTVTVRDGAGAPVRGARVRLTASGEGHNLPAPPTTDDAGATKTFLHASRVGPKTVTAEVEVNGAFVSLPTTVDVTFVAGPGEGVEFLVQPGTTKAGVAIAPAVTLALVDRNGNRATEAGALMLSLRLVRSTGGTVAGGAARAPVNGVFTFDALVINRPQAGYALRAELSNGGAAESQQFDVVLGDLSPATSTFEASPVNVVADGATTTTLTLTARDTGGNVLGGQAVTLAVTGTGNTLGAASGTTDGAGVFSTTLKSSVAEAKTVTATLGAGSLTTAVTFIP